MSQTAPLVIEVRAQTFPVEISVSDDHRTASYVVQYQGRGRHFDSWEAMYAWLLEDTRKAAVPLEIEFVNPENFERGTVYAIHAATGYPMVKWASGAREQFTMTRNVWGAMEDHEIEEARRLTDAAKAAQAELREYVQAFEMPLRKMIEAAQAGAGS